MLSINDVALTEGNAGTTNFTFRVSLSAPAPAGGVTFDIATADNTATVANSDYTAKSLTGQTIPAGSSTYDFTVTVNGDLAFEPNETFFVNVTNVTGASVSDGQGQGTINNDDCNPPVTSAISGSNSVCPNQTSMAYSVTNTPGSTYAWTITGGTQASGTNTSSITVNWGAAGPGNVSVVETNAALCVGAAVNLPVTIASAVSAGSLSSNVTTICQGGSVDISLVGNTGTNGYIIFQNGIVINSLSSVEQVETFLSSAAPGDYCLYVFAYSANPVCSNIAGLTLAQLISNCFAGQCYDVSQPLCVTVYHPPTITCPTNTTVAACQTQSAVNAAFITWLFTATASGGSNGALINNSTGAPSACGGSTTVTFTYISSCAPATTTCQATFTVAAPPTVSLT
jgi:hypothetical protein